MRHPGPCGKRERCPRPECRERFGDYKTVEVLPNGVLIYRCHNVRTDDRIDRAILAASR